MTSPGRRTRVRFSYRAIQAWAWITVSVVLRRLHVTAMSRLPEDRPVILTANHRSALADVAIMIRAIPEYPHFLAAASWWKSPPARMLFNAGGVVPIHRRRDGEGTEENSSAFEACNTTLASGARIAIFPEGEMSQEPALLPLKTGAARIALGAAADAGIPGVVVVPVGLAYEDMGRFRGVAEMQFGEPIEIDEWIESYRSDPAKAVRGVTDLIADRLAQVTVNHGSADEAKVIDRAAAIALADAAGVSGEAAVSEFVRRNAIRRALADALTLTGGESSREYRDLVAVVDAHALDLERLGIEARDVSSLDAGAPGERSRVLVEVVALSAPAAVGFVANAPVLLAVQLARRRFPQDAWQWTVMGVSGTVLFPVVWACEYGILAHHLGRSRALALTTAGVAGGLAAVAWSERLRAWRRMARRERLEREQRPAFEQARASRAAVRGRVEALVGEIPRAELG
jgi:glycerol-3-phosphate O-acyltransferase / dihydroxyacetone phosphate acyltransferase